MSSVANKSINTKYLNIASVVAIFISILFSFHIAEFEYAIFILFTALTFVFSILLMNKIAYLFDFTKLTIPVFFWYTYLAIIYVPSFFIYFERGRDYRDIYLFAVNSVLITVPIGAILSNWLFYFKKKNLDNFYNSEVTLKDTPQVRKVFISLLSFSIIITALFIYEVKTVPLFEILKRPNLVEFARILRAESFLHLKSKFLYFYSWLRSFIYPFLIVFSFGNFITTKNKFWKYIFIITLLTGLFYNSLTTEKLPVASIFIMIGIFYLMYKKWKVNAVFYIIILVIAIAPIFIILSLIIPKEQVVFQGIFTSILKRSFRVPAEVLYYYFEIFPDKISFLGISAIKTFSNIFGVDYFNVPAYVMKYMMQTPVTIGHANACFIGIAYAGWSFEGVIFMGLLTGFILESAQIFIVRYRRSILTLSLLSFYLYESFHLNSVELFSVLLTFGGILSLFIFWLFNMKYNN